MAILVAVLIVTVVGASNNYSKERQFKELDKQKQIKPVEVIRDGRPCEVLSEHLLVGDVILLNEGERVPADCLFVDGRGGVGMCISPPKKTERVKTQCVVNGRISLRTLECRVNESAMTGESAAVLVNTDCPPLLSGSIVHLSQRPNPSELQHNALYISLSVL